MAVEIKAYTLTSARLRKGFCYNLQVNEQGFLVPSAGEGGVFFSNCFDSACSQNDWGRLQLKIAGENVVGYRVLVTARNQAPEELDGLLQGDELTVFQKLELFGTPSARVVENLPDLELSGVRGRYLWFALELVGGEGTQVEGGVLYTPGDSFEEYLPQVYSGNSFLRRYLSIFSSIYLDLERSVGDYPRQIDLATADERMLPVLADWLGVRELCEFLPPHKLRRFLGRSFALNQQKGTAWVLRQLVGILTEAIPAIAERVFFPQSNPVYDSLYGDSPHCFTVLLFQEPTQEEYFQLEHLIELYKPLCARANLVVATRGNALDTYTYLGINAMLCEELPGMLGSGAGMGNNVVLA